MLRYISEILPDSNSFKKYYNKKRRAKNIHNKKRYIPEYLKGNDFEVELNYKLWVTKGARFEASERCEELDARYNRIVGWVSSYLIIFSVLNLCKIPFFILPDNCSTFISISLSILILVFSQFSYAKSYSIHAKNYHDCALEIAKLYNELRLSKSGSKHSIKNIYKIKNEYEKILDKYNNHLPIDLMMFKLKKKEYFNITIYSSFFNHIRYFMLVRSAYYFCVFLLPILYCSICIINQIMQK